MFDRTKREFLRHLAERVRSHIPQLPFDGYTAEELGAVAARLGDCDSRTCPRLATCVCLRSGLRFCDGHGGTRPDATRDLPHARIVRDLQAALERNMGAT